MRCNFLVQVIHPTFTLKIDDILKTLVRSINQGTNVQSLDFHPIQHTILLVGTNVGDIAIWEVGSKERLAHKTFKTAFMKDATVSVNRCLWSPDGSILGVAFSKHIVQTYVFSLNGEFRQQLEVELMTWPSPIQIRVLSIITCGDDKIIKMWDAANGHKQYTFEGHEALVYSIWSGALQTCAVSLIYRSGLSLCRPTLPL
ncbi:hypothetical protein ZIOFF_011821 [Zingiber officinale]|uniref:Uncharacterized protein n=1 Tax=Zingiber officinale TaxID=94328 RepID=A0A8J5I6P5_ZINOF|nr:hypothetical protein ZIOFF_011821 [Zingiber officinale]